MSRRSGCRYNPRARHRGCLAGRVREPPTDVSDADVLAAVRRHWSPDVDAVEHLPVGFGAHHWVGIIRGRRTHFLTLDSLGGKHDAASLEAAYAAASGLMFPLDFVVAPMPTFGGPLTVPFAAGALSATPWIPGDSPERLDLAVTSAMLTRLHARTPPAGLPRWAPLTPPTLADDLVDLDADALGGRPLRRTRPRRVARTARRGGRLVGRLPRAGGPRERTPLGRSPTASRTSATRWSASDRTLLVDWETILLAPAERDWRTLVERGLPVASPGLDLDAAMLELFDLEWRLDEISQYAAWFAGPHSGTAATR